VKKPSSDIWRIHFILCSSYYVILQVYLYQGAVHIIPNEPGNGQDSNSLSVRDAIFQVRTQPQKTIASPAIQEAIQARIEG
jgi:hypothetical protein